MPSPDPRLDLCAHRRGLFVKLPSTQVIELAVAAGFDFVIVDLEHSLLDFAAAASLVGHARVVGLPALVRLPAVDAGLINRLLEAGAAGIQISSVTSAEQVRALRRAMRYAPNGERSIGTAHRGAEYGRVPTARYVGEQYDAPPLAVVQIETPIEAAALEAVLASGPDVAFVGQADLAVALDFDGKAVARAVHGIIDVARRFGVPVGGIGLPSDLAPYEVVGADIALLSGAFDRALAARIDGGLA